MQFASISPESRAARTLAGAGAALLIACAAGAAIPSAQEPGAPAPPGGSTVFRTRTDLVVLQVSVVDAAQRFVPGLQQDDFSVYEEGRRQPLALFASSTSPLDLMVLLDTSGSMAERLPLAVDAAIALLRGLRDGDRAGVILFNDRVQVAQPLLADRRAAERAIRRATPIGATAVHEALYIALRDLARARRTGADMRRQAVVVLSDGADNRSRVVFDDVLEEARRGAVTVFTILPAAVEDQRFPVSAPSGARGAFEMRRIAEETGGRVFLPQTATDLAGIYDDIGGELSQQYWLAYVPTATAAGFRRVSVRVDTRPGLRARTRSGYYAAGLPRTSR